MRFMTQAMIYTMVLTKVTVKAQCLVQLLLAYFSTSASTFGHSPKPLMALSRY